MIPLGTRVAEARERPILFSGPMIKAILAGTKTQTRRVVKPQPFWLDAGTAQPVKPTGPKNVEGYLPHVSPYGATGDTLYVRETWRVQRSSSTMRRAAVAWRADGSDAVLDVTDGYAVPEATKDWRPSIFMPRWASRITLRVTDVRVERVQSISEEDAKAEGVEPFHGLHASQRLCVADDTRTQGTHPHTIAYASLWDSINGDREGCAWRDNCWVWCVDFQRVTT